MKSFIQQEFKNVLKQKFIYPIRLYFQVLGFLLVSQSLYSLVDSFFRLGEFQVIWGADWVYNASFLFWFVYLITIITIGKSTDASGKNC